MTLERHNIVRGAFRNLGRVIGVMVLSMLAWVGGFALAASAGLEMSTWGFALPVGFVMLMVAMLMWLNLPGSVTIGADGILVDWRGETRYVAWSAISSADLFFEMKGGKKIVGVQVELASSESLQIAIGEDQFGARERADRLCAAITEGRDRHRSHEVIAEDAERLGRRELADPAWLARLRSLGAGANAGMREAPVPRDRLWRIVEDPSASAPARAAAAVALGPAMGAEGKTRLATVASQTVSPKLRVALQKAPSNDDAALLEALAEVEAEEAASAVQRK